MQILLLFFLGLPLAGCALMGPGESIAPSVRIPVRVQVPDVPFFAQKAYQCGPAALAMTLNWSGVPSSPDSLVPYVFTPGRKGSLQTGLITAARRHGRLAVPLSGLDCLLREVAAGRPVIVMQNLGLKWLPKWHYAVVIGYDLYARYVVLHTGESALRQVGLNTFMHTWRRADQWGLLTLPAGQMPICSETPVFLKSVLGLQQAGYVTDAAKAFGNAVERWPESVEANMALGNAQYALKSLQAAVGSFERALDLDPSNGAAMNNLAHILGEMGELDAAEAMARRAVSTGGPFSDLYRRTLEEIRRKRPVTSDLQ
jgi:hypothetical protein